MAPFNNEWMVKSMYQTNLIGDVIMYFKDATSSIDTTLANITGDFTGTSIRDVLVYKSTTSSVEFPVVAGYAMSVGGTTIIASPSYTVGLPNAVAKNVMIVGDEILVSHYDFSNGAGFYKLDAVSQ